MKIITLTNHIDFEEAVRDALAAGWVADPASESVAIIVSTDQMSKVQEAVNKLKHFCEPIIKGCAIASYEKAENIFMVKLEVPK